MFPPLLCLVLLFGLVPCFPLGVFPLPLLTLKKRLYLREQDTGKATGSSPVVSTRNHRNQAIPVIFGGDYWTRTSGLMRVKIR